jgi:hypothetical protein
MENSHIALPVENSFVEINYDLIKNENKEGW